MMQIVHGRTISLFLFSFLFLCTNLFGMDAQPAVKEGNILKRVLGEHIFGEDVSTEMLKNDLIIIRNLDDMEHKVILFSVLQQFCFRSQAEGKQSHNELLIEELKKMELELKKELSDEQLRIFISREGKQPNPDQLKKIQEAALRLYQGVFAMAPYEKLQRLSELEAYYLKKESKDDVRESRRVFFEWAREKVYEEIQEMHIYLGKKPKKGWAKYKDLVIKSAMAAVLIGGAYLGYHKIWGGQNLNGLATKEESEVLKELANDEAFTIACRHMVTEKAKFKEVLLTNKRIDQSSWTDLKKKLAKVDNFDTSPDNEEDVIRRAFIKVFGEDMARKQFLTFYSKSKSI